MNDFVSLNNPLACTPGVLPQLPGSSRQGDRGVKGANGAAGRPAWTTTATRFVMPPPSGMASVDVVSPHWLETQRFVFIENAGYFEVVQVFPEESRLLARNTGSVFNSLPNSIVPNGSKVCAGAMPGPNSPQTFETLAEKNALLPACALIAETKPDGEGLYGNLNWRHLNEVVYDSKGIFSLVPDKSTFTANRGVKWIAVPPGRWHVQASMPVHRSGRARGVLMHTREPHWDDAVFGWTNIKIQVVYGQNVFSQVAAAPYDQSFAKVSAVIEHAAVSYLIVANWKNDDDKLLGLNGNGVASNFGQTELYAAVRIREL